MTEQIGEGWTLYPLKGASGQAFRAAREDEVVFVKRNSTSFLAAASMEGITPKLVWTKRTADGNYYSAQEWVNGHTLSPREMQDRSVILLIHRYHFSDQMTSMLKKIGGEEWSASDFLNEAEANISDWMASLVYVAKVRDYLRQSLDDVESAPHVVCHGDLNHSNFLMTDHHRLYLVDWDTVKLADPIYDISQVLVQYIPMEKWDLWLKTYNAPEVCNTHKRLEWYALYNLLLLMENDLGNENYHDFNCKLEKVRRIYNQRNFY